MRILAAADIHGDHGIYRHLLKAAHGHKVQALILAGDLLGYAPGFLTAEEAQRADADKIFGLLEASSTPVLYIMGNDDLVELGSFHERILPLHGRRLDIGSYNFVGYQFSLPFMGGINEKSDESIAEDLAGLSALADKHTVFVTHSPAKGFLDTTMLGAHAGSSSILGFIERAGVRAHIHGHIHGCFGRNGRHFNVAVLPAMKAILIDVDKMTHQEVGIVGEQGD
jgi:Icc-related predicted phosphoesterase